MNSIEDKPYLNTSPEQAVSYAFSWSGFFMTLFICVGILLLVLWFIRRAHAQNQFQENSWLRVIDRQQLNQQSFYLVEVAGKVYVMSINAHHTEVISEIDNPNIIREIYEDISSRPANSIETSLIRQFKKFLSGQALSSRGGFPSELKQAMKRNGGRKRG